MDFQGERRSNQTHQSTTDSDSRLRRKEPGNDATLSYVGELLMENRHAVVVDACAVAASETPERDAAMGLLADAPTGRATVGGDKGHTLRPFVEAARRLGVTPHVAAKKTDNAIDARRTRHPGYAVSQRIRKRVDEVYGWMKTVGLLRRPRHHGGERVNWIFLFTAAANNLIRMRPPAARAERPGTTATVAPGRH